MPDTSVNIAIMTSGASQAKAALDEAAGGLRNISEKHQEMAGHFQEKIQHIGLKLFAADAIKSIGLGGETRMMLGLVNSALMGAATAAGVGSGGILLLVTAFGTLSQIIQTVLAHQKGLNEELAKLNKSHGEELDVTNKVIKSIEAYEKETGNVPAYLKAWEESEKALQKAQVDRQIQGDKAQISTLTLLNNQGKLHVAQLKDEIVEQEKLLRMLKSSGVDSTTVAAQTAQLEKMRKEYSNQTLEISKNKAQVDQLIVSVKMLGKEGTSNLDDLTEAHKKIREAAEATSKAESEADTARYQNWAMLGQKQTKEHEKMYTKMRETAMHTLDAINTTQSNAFAKAIVEGKSFSDQFTHIWRDIAEQVIAEIERIIVKMLVLAVIEKSIGFGSVAGPSAATLSFIGHASGTNQLVTSPKLFLAGEAGPEFVSITPTGGGSGGRSSGGGGGGTSFGDIYVSVQGVDDPARIADAVGQRIIENIRGRGQLNFLRT